MIGIEQRDYELSTEVGHNKEIIRGLKKLITERPDIQLTLFKVLSDNDYKYYLTTDRYFYEVGNNRVFVSSVGLIFEKFKTEKTIERRILGLVSS
jgi:hypothetical protein